MNTKPTFNLGETVSNQDITREFRVGNMGGMRKNNSTNVLVLISDHSKGIYDDKWTGNVLHYTGMGKKGNQELKAQNLTLAESRNNNVEIHLFEVLVPKQYVYQGTVELAADPYQDVQIGQDGLRRKVWIFPLRSTGEFHIIAAHMLEAQEANQQRLASILPKDELHEIASARSTKEVASRVVMANVRLRDQIVAEYAKVRANGICQLCDKPAPFKDKNGKPYLESHHIVWLANGGEDSIENTVALCPNCHRRMHVLNSKNDVTKLLRGQRLLAIRNT